ARGLERFSPQSKRSVDRICKIIENAKKTSHVATRPAGLVEPHRTSTVRLSNLETVQTPPPTGSDEPTRTATVGTWGRTEPGRTGARSIVLVSIIVYASDYMGD